MTDSEDRMSIHPGRIAAGVLIGGLLAGGGLACPGCESRNLPANLLAEDNPYLSEGRVQFTDGWTRDHIKVVREPVTERVGSGLLKVTLVLRNTTKDHLWCEFRTRFLDANGLELDRGPSEPRQLERSTVTEYSYTSMNNQAADYQIIIGKASKSSMKLP